MEVPMLNGLKACINRLFSQKSEVIEDAVTGMKSWVRNGELHREDGPAIEFTNGAKWWFRNGNLHREDGPAIENEDGSKRWYYDGKPVAPPAASVKPAPRP
jgi:hypothetical protein